MIYEQETFDILPLFSTPVLVVKEIFEDNHILFKHLPKVKMKRSVSNSISTNKQLFKTDTMFKNLRDYCTKWVNFYAHEVMKIDQKQSQIYFTQSCAYSSAKTEKHHLHHHPNSIISGVYYFNDSNTDLVFVVGQHPQTLEINRSGYHLYNATSHNVKPQAGRLVLFPSTLQHRTEICKEDVKRWSLSFNTFIKGNLGVEDDVTELCLT